MKRTIVHKEKLRKDLPRSGTNVSASFQHSWLCMLQGYFNYYLPICLISEGKNTRRLLSNTRQTKTELLLKGISTLLRLTQIKEVKKQIVLCDYFFKHTQQTNIMLFFCYLGTAQKLAPGNRKCVCNIMIRIFRKKSHPLYWIVEKSEGKEQLISRNSKTRSLIFLFSPHGGGEIVNGCE